MGTRRDRPGTAVTKAPAGGLSGAFAAAQIFFAIVAAVCHPSLASASAALGIVAESKSVSPPIIENIVVIDVPVQKEFSIGRVGADYSPEILSGVDNLNYALPICVLQFQQEFLRWVADFGANVHFDIDGRRTSIIPIKIFYRSDASKNFLAVLHNDSVFEMDGMVPHISPQFALRCLFGMFERGVGYAPHFFVGLPQGPSEGGDKRSRDRGNDTVVVIHKFSDLPYSVKSSVIAGALLLVSFVVIGAFAYVMGNQR